MSKPIRVIEVGPPINKPVNWLLVFLTGGLWLPFYWLKLLGRGMKR